MTVCAVYLLCELLYVERREGGQSQETPEGTLGYMPQLKVPPQEAERVAKIREGYYQAANSSLSLGPGACLATSR